MPGRPYREPAPIDPGPAPEPTAALARLGSLRSVHAPPPLHRALLGPILIAGLVVGVGAAVGGPLAIVAPFGAATLVLLAWSPLRTRGFSAALHAHGLLITQAGVRRPVAFEDVNEVWFEIDRLQGQAGASLLAIRLVDFDGEVHRLPLGVSAAAALADGVLRACSGPLLTEARQALAEGETLTFGHIQLDRAGITVAGARIAWQEVRLAVVQRGKVYLYRRWPIFSWRTLSLARIPNPTVFVRLLMASVPRVRVDDQIIVPFASGDEAVRAQAAEAAKGGVELGLQNMLIGGVFFLAGLAITWATYSRHGDTYILAYGPILFGAVRFYQGLAAYRSGPRR
ncbi:DUF6585 family protein [Polyangium jinanense]|uniref:Uncharacterized protein n=1 Tax=Polyangium jinanense TaxID=2829994 RepID=A0A9X4APY5_9BACT|nr:DUF6585 family protein [Polyangium jinanense]MDC3952905.1 hypothetical protein [Polyangium jinanense]MDC3980524.1 hypothetical protein [Polyangium jinanense]